MNNRDVGVCTKYFVLFVIIISAFFCTTPVFADEISNERLEVTQTIILPDDKANVFPFDETELTIPDVQDITITNNITLTENIAYKNVDLKSGTINLNGFTMQVYGSILQTGGTMNINGGSLVINGDYRIQTKNEDGTYSQSPSGSSTGVFKMINGNDRVLVNGGFYTNSYSAHNSLLTAGVLEVKGDFAQYGTNNYFTGAYANFAASGAHKVVLSGNDVQNVSFDNRQNSGFQDLELQNTKINFVTPIRGWVVQRDTVIDGDLQIEGVWNLNEKTMTINGVLEQTSGTMFINGGSLVINGDYRIQTKNEDGTYSQSPSGSSTGVFKMINGNDRVLVNGGFYTNSYSAHNSLLTAGVLEVKGDFAQYGTNNYFTGAYANFAASGAHKVVLSGNDVQNVSFDNRQNSGFQDLELQNTKINFVTPIRGWVVQRDTVIDGNLQIEGVLNLNEKTMTINGVLAQTSGTMFINGGSLVINGDYRIQTKNEDGTYSQSPNGSSTGVLKMINGNDRVLVNGGFYTNSYTSHNSLLTAGVLEVKGDFAQYGTDIYFTGTYANFAASGAHKVVLSGNDVQNVHFDSEYSHFNTLIITKPLPEGYLLSRTPCWNELITYSTGENENNKVRTGIPALSMNISVFQNENDMLSSSDRYVASEGATVTVDGVSYPTNSAGTVVTSIPSGDITVSKDGYIGVTLNPSSLLSSNKIYLEKADDNLPVIKNVALGGVNIRGETVTITEDTIGNIKVDIDWNGNPEQIVNIQQGITTIPVNGGQTGNVALGNLLKGNDDIYLYVKTTNGKAVKKKLNIKCEPLERFNEISYLLNNFEVIPEYNQQVGESVEFLSNMEMGFGLPFMPVSFELDGNKVSALIGMSAAGSSSWEKGGQAKMAFDTLKDIKMSGRDIKAIWNQYRNLKPIPPIKGKFAVDGDFTVAGYLEGEVILIDGKYTIDLTDSFLLINGEVGYNAYYPVYAPPPVFLEWYIKGGIEAKLNLDSQNGIKVNEKSSITGKIALGGGIGVGIPAIISVAGGAEGELTATIPFKKPIEPDVDLDTNLWFKGTFIGMTIPNPPININLVKRHLIPSQHYASSLTSSLNAEILLDIINTNEAAAPISRDYLSKPSNFVANAPNKMMFSVSTPTNKITHTIKTNVYPQSKPQLVSLGDNKQLLVWLDDDSTRNDYNRTSLMYSYYNGVAWGNPQTVDNDGTADFSPQLKDINGTPYIVWQNAKIAFDETVTVDTMSANMEIAVSKYDINTNTFTNITNLSNDSLVDMLPKISGNGTEITATWVKNLGNDIFGLTPQNNIMMSTFNGIDWSSPTAVYENLNAIDDVTVGYTNGNRIIAYSLDVDNDITTVNDKELYINGVKATTNDVLDSKPNFAVDRLYWYSGGQISYIDNFGTNEIKSILPEGQIMPNDRFEVLSNVNGDSSIVFEKSDGLKSELYSFIYDKTADQWSNSVKLTQLDSKIDGFSGFLDSSGVVKAAFNKVAIVGEIGSSEPYGQADLSTFEVSPVYNLSMDDPFYSEDTLVTGNDMELNFDLNNKGELTVNNITVQILDSNDNLISTTDLAMQLRPGETKECIANYKVPENFIPRDIKVKVSPKSQVDFDLTDNIKTVNLNYIDVAVEDLYYGNKADGTKIIYAHIVNRSLDALSNVEVILVENTPDGTVLETKKIVSLDSLGADMVTFEQTVTENKVFYVVVKPVENETMLGNNNDFILIEVGALATAISNATDLLSSKTIGTLAGNVSQEAHDAYNTAIIGATIVKDNAAATQAEVDAAVAILATATTNFNNAIITEVIDTDYTATPIVQIGINPNDGDGAGIFVGLKDIRDAQGNVVPDAKLADYQIEVHYDHNQAKVLDVVNEAHWGQFTFNEGVDPSKVSVEDEVYQGSINFEKLFFVPLALTGTSSNSTHVIIKFVSLSDSNTNQIKIPDVTLIFQRGKILNEANNRNLSLVDAVAGLQYLAKIVDSGTDTGKVNVINMASILPPETGTTSVRPSVKDVIALMQKLVGLRDDTFQLISGS